MRPPARVADLGCASGTFATILRREGFRCAGIDISHAMTALGRRQHPTVSFVTGDIEALPFGSGSLDAVFLTGVLHHLPNPSACAQEVFRVLRPGGAFVAFDPNGANPFFYLYRDPDSPLSAEGSQPEQRPALAVISTRILEAGIQVNCDYLSGLAIQQIASAALRPAGLRARSALFWPRCAAPLRLHSYAESGRRWRYRDQYPFRR